MDVDRREVQRLAAQGDEEAQRKLRRLSARSGTRLMLWLYWKAEGGEAAPCMVRADCEMVNTEVTGQRVVKGLLWATTFCAYACEDRGMADEASVTRPRTLADLFNTTTVLSHGPGLLARQVARPKLSEWGAPLTRRHSAVADGEPLAIVVPGGVLTWRAPLETLTCGECMNAAEALDGPDLREELAHVVGLGRLLKNPYPEDNW